MDVKGKTKNNIKARLDLALFCNWKNMELVFDGSRVTKPRASFMLEKNTQLIVYKWLKSLRFPDGHASNISRLVNMEECRLYGMKSHNCDMFMQTLIPLTFRDLLPKASICEAYIVKEISTFISYYFEPHLRTRINRVPRHDDGGEVSSSRNLSIFSNPGWPTHKNAVRGRYLSEIEFKQAHNYVLFNCDELRSFIQ